jgi:hypothetical protein
MIATIGLTSSGEEIGRAAPVLLIYSPAFSKRTVPASNH